MMDYAIEQRLPYARIAGVDEVGRGPWAGPVTAAAVILDPRHIPDGLNDSKKLSAKRREALVTQIEAFAEIGIGTASVAEIDEINILQASHLAMRRAIAALHTTPDFALIDGNRMPGKLPCPAQTLIGGDGRAASIAAASIIAKVHRDAHMIALSKQHPGYGWETNKGYGTEKHRVGLFCHGVTPHHRRSFKPIHNILYPQKNISD